LPTPVTAAEKMGLCCENWVEKWGENSGGGKLKVFAIVAELRAASCVALAVKRGLEQNLLLK